MESGNVAQSIFSRQLYPQYPPRDTTMRSCPMQNGCSHLLPICLLISRVHSFALPVWVCMGDRNAGRDSQGQSGRPLDIVWLRRACSVYGLPRRGLEAGGEAPSSTSQVSAKHAGGIVRTAAPVRIQRVLGLLQRKRKEERGRQLGYSVPRSLRCSKEST